MRWSTEQVSLNIEGIVDGCVEGNGRFVRTGPLNPKLPPRCMVPVLRVTAPIGIATPSRKLQDFE
jgi:hypothetical protein